MIKISDIVSSVLIVCSSVGIFIIGSAKFIELRGASYSTGLEYCTIILVIGIAARVFRLICDV